MNWDIFISYRRESDEHLAGELYKKLGEHGYRVFLDTESLGGGQFNEKLFDIIDKCKDFIIILSEDSLERCVNENDWVRLELAHALIKQKNIIPVMHQGFHFPAELPECIETVRFQNALELVKPSKEEYLDIAIKQLIKKYLQSKPLLKSRIANKATLRTSIIACLCVIILFFGVWGVNIVYNNSKTAAKIYPRTQAEKNAVNGMITYVTKNTAVMDSVLFGYHNILKYCEEYLDNPLNISYENFKKGLNDRQDDIQEIILKSEPLSDDLAKELQDSLIDVEDLRLLAASPDVLWYYFNDQIDSLSLMLNPKLGYDKEMIKEVIDIIKEEIHLESQSIIIALSETFLPVDESATEDFRILQLSKTNLLSKDIELWTSDKNTIQSKNEAIFNAQQALLTDYAAVVSDQYYEYIKMYNESISFFMQNGMTRDEAEEYIDFFMSMSEDEREMYQKMLESGDIKAETEIMKLMARERFTPELTDDPEYIWGKALHFLSLDMYDDAVNAMQIYLERVRDEDQTAFVYVPAAINFVEQIEVTGFDYGVLICDYEQGAPPHSVYQIGDIVVAINSIPTPNGDAFIDIKQEYSSETAYRAAILRSDDNGELKLFEVSVPFEDSRVYIISLSEN